MAKTKAELQELLNQITDVFPDQYAVYEDIEQVEDKIIDIIGKDSVGKDVSYYWCEPNGDSADMGCDLDTIFDTIYKQQQQGRKISAWAYQWSVNILFVLISYED